jgi:hypothetical protein
MRTILRSAFAAALLVLFTHQGLAQPVNGCPAGQAMQSSDPSGRNITCLPVGGGGAEADIVGRWGVTGSSQCLQSSSGFDLSTLSPIIVPVAPPLSQISGSFMGTRTFYAGGTGQLVGTTQVIIFSGPVTSITPVVSASATTMQANFTWSPQSDGTLLIDDDNSISQPFTAPASRLGFTLRKLNTQSFVAHLSKDKRTLVMAHEGMAVETNELRDASNALVSSSSRLCARSHVATRLP